jgi:hypothetical protein
MSDRSAGGAVAPPIWVRTVSTRHLGVDGRVIETDGTQIVGRG